MTLTPKGNQPAVLETDAEEVKVEAVAGSGKTTTMVGRIQKEIEDHGRAPNRLLVLTFAKEASHNIQEKLREDLFVPKLEPDKAFEVDVYNYHSFCYQILQEYAYYKGISPDFELITDERRPQIIESVYDEVDFSFVSPGNPATGGEADTTLNELGKFIKRMRRESVSPKEIREYLPADDTIRNLLTLTDKLYDASIQTVNVDENDLMGNSDDLADACDRLAIVYRSKADSFSAAPEFERTISEYLSEMAEVAERIGDSLRTTDDDDLSWQDYRIADILFEDNLMNSSDIKQTPYGRLNEFAQMLRRTRGFIDAYEAYLDELEERGALDYDELINQAVQLLESEEVRKDILSQWDMVFCDEFQDTDESQRGLVDALREEMQIMVIGDSDQAIHEWRGQDPENMDKLPDSFEEIGLPLNFRSHQSILDITNYLHRDKQKIDADRDPAPPSVMKVNSEEEETVKQVSTTISHLLTNRFDEIDDDIDFGDIVVLARRNSQVREIAKELDEASIPYSVSGGAAKELSPGLQTVLSYLRILVTPEDDVSWQRVLLLLYRVPEADIDEFIESGETIPAGYNKVDRSDLEAPDRAQQAFEDYTELKSVSATHSISELYMHLKEETKIEWFLTDDDRNALKRIDQLMSSFSESPIQSHLTEDVVSYLERQAYQLNDDAHTSTEQGSQSDDAVSVMTIHQAKGLDFDTVLLPFLLDDRFGSLTLNRYQQNLYTYDVLVDLVSNQLDEPLFTDFSTDQISEEWRILHVALTRAENHLFMFGQNISHEHHLAGLIDRQLHPPDSGAPIEWSARGPQMQIWNALMESYDQVKEDNSDAVQDYTDLVNRGVDEDAGNITFYGNDIQNDEAIDNLLDAADEFVAAELADDTVGTGDFADIPLGEEPPVSLARQHSHTALETLQECERRHVLDFVVEAFPDPQTTTPGSSGAKQRAIGTLFHEVAELAYWRGLTTPSEWKDACEWLADTDETVGVIEETKDCIDTFFNTDAAGWAPIGAEIPVELEEIDEVDGSITGFLDSVRQHPDAGLAVLDYKTSHEKKSLQESQQLILYIKAAIERFDEKVTHAGYVYVGEAGPDVQLFEKSQLEARWDEVIDKLTAADESSYENVTSGSHCKYCEHRSLGCSGSDYEYEDAFELN